MRMIRAVMAVSILAAGTALAQPSMLLGGAPLSLMNKKDIELYEAALRKSLDSGQDGEKSLWSNPNSGASGLLQPQRSFTQGGKQCRDLYMETKAKGRNEKGTWPFCKEADGSWKLSPGVAGK